jgi:hypothetical protein
MKRLSTTAWVFAISTIAMCATHHQADPKVTLTLPATSVEKALRALSNVAQVPLAASPQTANDIVTLRFKDVPLSQAMAKLAEAIDGTWKQEKDINRLIRTSEQLKAEEAKEFQQDVLHIRTSIQKRIAAEKNEPAWTTAQADALAAQVSSLLKQFDPNALNSDWYKKSAQLGAKAPIGRVITKLLNALDPELIASTTSSYKSVWSTNPTSVQRPMPPEVVPIIEEFVQEQNDWTAALERYQVSNPVFNGATYSVGDFGVLPSAGKPAAPIATVILTIQNWGAMTGFNVEFSAYDARGKKVERAQVNIGNVYADMESEGKGSDDAEDDMIYYEGDAKDFYESQAQSARSTLKPLPRDLLAKVVDAEDFDPLSFTISPALQSAAHTRGWNMVASLPDNLISLGFMPSGKGVRVNQFLKRLKYCQTEWTQKDGWLVVKPMRPSEARASRANRHDLAAYLEMSSQPARLGLNDQAYFALRLPEQHLNGLPAIMARIVSPELQPLQDELMLKFYGLLSKDQISRMEAEGLAIRSLTENQVELLNRMVYGPNAFVQFQPVPDRNGYVNRDPEEYSLYEDGILRETTSSLPNGLPPEGLIFLNATESTVVAAVQEARGSTQVFEPESLAWQKYTQEHPTLFPAQESQSIKLDFNHLRRGEQLNMNFRFTLTPNLSLNRTLQGLTFPNSAPITLSDLPEPFQKRFNTTYDMYQKAYAKSGPMQFVGTTGATSPPPPK